MSRNPAFSGKPVLYGYWRSTAAFRVRIALNLKGIAWESAPVHLVKGGGEQHGVEFRAKNPAGLVPALEWGGATLTQSLAICEFLEEVQPSPALLPEDIVDRAWVRAFAADFACDVHPLNNLRVLQYLGGTLGQAETAKTEWMHHWMHRGFAAAEKKLEQHDAPSEYCFGDAPGMADIFLVAQAYNADRFAFDLGQFPLLKAIVVRCGKLDAFRDAAPEKQSDAE